MTSSETTFNDAELIARLRDAVNDEHDMTPHGADVLQAADRIAELLAERNDWESHAIYNAEFVDLAVSYRNERDAARAKLAKAVEAGQTMDDGCDCERCNKARATLAEIKGEIP